MSAAASPTSCRVPCDSSLAAALPMPCGLSSSAVYASGAAFPSDNLSTALKNMYLKAAESVRSQRSENGGEAA